MSNAGQLAQVRLIGLPTDNHSLDVVEYKPSRDINGLTAVVAAKLVREIAALAARGA